MTAIAQKETEIGMIPDDWTLTSIGSEFDVQQGKQVSARTRAGENQKPFLRTANLFWNRIDLTVLDKMNFTDAEVLRMTIKVNDVFVCEGGDIGRTALVTTELPGIYYQNHLHRLRAKNNTTNPLFFVYWMMYCLQFTEYYNGAGNKTTIPNLSQSRLKALLFPKPERAEQDSIADILSLIQSAIQKQEQIINTTTELKNALMKKLFTEGMNTELLKETEIGMIPVSWEVVKLGEAVDFFQYGLSVKGNKDCVGHPLLRMTNQQDGKIVNTNMQYAVISEKEIKKFRVDIGDILFNRTNSIDLVGRTSIFGLEGNYVFASYLIRIKTKKDSLNPFYLNDYFNSENAQTRLKFLATRGVSQSNISASRLSTFYIPLPSLKDQNEIVDSLSSITGKINLHKRKQQTLQSLFQSLLHQLMTGNFRIKDLVLQEQKKYYKPKMYK